MLNTSRSTKNDVVVVCGAGGFIAGHLVASLRRNGITNIRAVDQKPLDRWFQRFDDVENLSLDLKDCAACERAVASAHTFTILPPTWAAWDSSSTTKHYACSRS
jgi:nucleoside-diphosphate-sugar epimerase